MASGKENFISSFKAARTAFLQTLEGLDEAQASAITRTEGGWPSIKDVIGHIAATEREVVMADELIKRGEEGDLSRIEDVEFNQAQAAHRRSWPLAQVRAELDLNYEALLMAWDEYEGEDGPFGPSTWLKQPGSLWWLITQQLEYGRDIAARRGIRK